MKSGAGKKRSNDYVYVLFYKYAGPHIERTALGLFRNAWRQGRGLLIVGWKGLSGCYVRFLQEDQPLMHRKKHSVRRKIKRMLCPSCRAGCAVEDIFCRRCGADLSLPSKSLVPVQTQLPAVLYNSPLPRVVAGVGAVAVG